MRKKRHVNAFPFTPAKGPRIFLWRAGQHAMGSDRSAVRSERFDERLKRASQSYREGVSCARAVLIGFAMDSERLPAQRASDVCGVLRAADCILRHSCNASDQALGQVIERFRAEYHGVLCEEILNHADPSSHCCCMKVKDAVLLIQRALEQDEK